MIFGRFVAFNPIVAFFVLSIRDSILLVERGEYLGLPGTFPLGHETPAQCAARALDSRALTLAHGPCEFLTRMNLAEWDGKPATLLVFNLGPGWDIIAPTHPNAHLIDVARHDPRFDITVDAYRKYVIRALDAPHATELVA